MILNDGNIPSEWCRSVYSTPPRRMVSMAKYKDSVNIDELYDLIIIHKIDRYII